MNSCTSLSKSIHLAASFSFSWVFQHPLNLLVAFPPHETICVCFHSVQSFGRCCTAWCFLSRTIVDFSEALVSISAFNGLVYYTLCDFSSWLLSKQSLLTGWLLLVACWLTDESLLSFDLPVCLFCGVTWQGWRRI